jgi:hypothetical protein
VSRVEKHFVTFYSPGTFVAEDTTKPIRSWSTKIAMRMARTIKERYGAIPYGFQFTTRGRGPKDLDSKVVRKSPLYYLGGRIETVEEVRKRDDPKERTLLANMEGNKWDRIIVNDNSYRWTMPYNDTDVVLEWTP